MSCMLNPMTRKCICGTRARLIMPLTDVPACACCINQCMTFLAVPKLLLSGSKVKKNRSSLMSNTDQPPSIVGVGWRASNRKHYRPTKIFLSPLPPSQSLWRHGTNDKLARLAWAKNSCTWTFRQWSSLPMKGIFTAPGQSLKWGGYCIISSVFQEVSQKDW